MVEANAKTLRPLVKAAVKAALESRGWKSVRGGRFASGPDIVRPPLRALLNPDIVGDAYGGLRIGLSMRIIDPLTEQEASAYGLDALPTSRYLELGDWSVTSTDAGALTDPNRSYRHWLIVDTHDVRSTVEDWATVIDGPISDWLAVRNSDEALLDTVAAQPELTRWPLPVRLVSLIALRAGRSEYARELIGRYEIRRDDSPERIAEFERHLVIEHPDYGPLQRS